MQISSSDLFSGSPIFHRFLLILATQVPWVSPLQADTVPAHPKTNSALPGHEANFNLLDTQNMLLFPSRDFYNNGEKEEEGFSDIWISSRRKLLELLCSKHPVHTWKLYICLAGFLHPHIQAGQRHPEVVCSHLPGILLTLVSKHPLQSHLPLLSSTRAGLWPLSLHLG